MLQTTGHALYEVDKDVHERILKLVDDDVEWGGALNPVGTGATPFTLITSQQYDAVPIPSGLAQFHTHPRNCSDKLHRCALSIPSSADLIGFATSFARNLTLVHLLYSHAGVFIIMMNPECAIRCRESKQFLANLTRRIHDVLLRAIRKIKRNPQTYDIDAWLDLVHGFGFLVTLIPSHEIPKFYGSTIIK